MLSLNKRVPTKIRYKHFILMDSFYKYFYIMKAHINNDYKIKTLLLTYLQSFKGLAYSIM